jgi:hypothetical protein
MDRLVETVTAYLCRHRSVGLLRLTLDLTRRRLDLFAEIGAVEVVKGAGRRGVAGRRIRYARDPIREEAVSWPAVSTKKS